MQDSNSQFGDGLALADILANLQHAPLWQLELALDMTKEIKKAFVGITMIEPYGVWEDITNKLETEILERTLLKECTISNTTPSKS